MSPKPQRPLCLAAVAATVLALLSLAIPLYVIRPFVPQSPQALQLALEIRVLAPWLSILCAVVVLVAVFFAWTSSRWLGRTILILAVLLTLPTVALTRVNIFERMFHPNLAPAFDPAASAAVAPHDMVLAVIFAARARAYPIRTLGYHHIINDTVGGAPIAITYCTLCHTGLVWSRILGGRILSFRLAGINNGNALLRDEQTSSIWQQSTGEALFGPLRGQHLQLVQSDELTFATWRTEHPNGDVLRPAPPTASESDPPDWEQHVARTHVVVDTSYTGIDPHELMFAVTVGNIMRAYPLRSLLAANLIEEQRPIRTLLLLGPDGASIRAFDPGPLTFVRAASPTSSFVMTDSDTGSDWNFSGCAVSGPQTGHCLPQLEGHKTFWFDWLNHHHRATVYR